MNINKIVYLLSFAIFFIPAAYGMEITKTVGAGLFATGVGLMVVGVHNNKDFMKNRKLTYIDKEWPITKTLYFDNWVKEVLVPISAGAGCMLSGLLLATSGFSV